MWRSCRYVTQHGMWWTNVSSFLASMERLMSPVIDDTTSCYECRCCRQNRLSVVLLHWYFLINKKHWSQQRVEAGKGQKQTKRESEVKDEDETQISPENTRVCVCISAIWRASKSADLRSKRAARGKCETQDSDRLKELINMSNGVKTFFFFF